jgi:hypothetical protein
VWIAPLEGDTQRFHKFIFQIFFALDTTKFQIHKSFAYFITETGKVLASYNILSFMQLFGHSLKRALLFLPIPC